VIPLLLALGLADPERVLGSVATSLSEGMVRRVLLALALAQRPEFVVLDEPTAGLDRVARTATLDLLGERLQGRLGVVLVTHDLDLARLLLGDTGQSVLIEEGCPVSVEAGLGDGDGPLGPLIAAARDLGAWG
jgi:ABC-type multidrug transport system ATPase subunit